MISYNLAKRQQQTHFMIDLTYLTLSKHTAYVAKFN